GSTSPFAYPLGNAEETLSRAVLNDYAMLIVGQDNWIGHALHDRGHTGDSDFHVPHPIVVMLYLEKARKLAIGAVHQVAELPQLRLPGVLAKLSDHRVYIRPHTACGTDLLLNLQ